MYGNLDFIDMPTACASRVRSFSAGYSGKTSPVVVCIKFRGNDFGKSGRIGNFAVWFLLKWKKNDKTVLAQRDGLPTSSRYAAISAIAFGVGLSVLDGTVANVALPSIASDLGVSAADSIWVVNAYQLATVVSLLSLSALGDIVGYKRVYLVGLCVFLLGSVWCMASGQPHFAYRCP